MPDPATGSSTSLSSSHTYQRPIVVPLPPRWAALEKLGPRPLPQIGQWRNLD